MTSPEPPKKRPRAGQKRCFREKYPDQLPQSGTTASDCQRLIDEYVQKETVRFEEFVHLWKSKAYSLLQCVVDQRARHEHVEFILGQFTGQLRSDSLLACVASIYALYCAYVTQTAVPSVRIRLTVHLYQRIKQVHEWAKTEEHSDLDFIIRQLEWKKSFNIAAYTSELVVGSGKTYLEGGDPLDEFLVSHPAGYLHTVFSQSESKSLDELMKEYMDGKRLLSAGSDILEPLNYLQPASIEQLKDLFCMRGGIPRALQRVAISGRALGRT